jgi:hypothetical protein
VLLTRERARSHDSPESDGGVHSYVRPTDEEMAKYAKEVRLRCRAMPGPVASGCVRVAARERSSLRMQLTWGSPRADCCRSG